MKKSKWLSSIAATLAAAVLLAGCGGGDPQGPNGPNDPGDIAPERNDTYEDWSNTKTPSGDQFDFDGNYVPPELTIDGKGDEQEWQDTEELLKFGSGNAVSFKAYRGNAALFFLFDVKDTELGVYSNAGGDDVTKGDSIEFYIDTLADGGSKPQTDDYQINLGIHGKTRIMQGTGGAWGNWNGLIDYEVDLKGGEIGDGANDTGYSIEVMVPYNQIMIEKDDTIAVSFGLVNKTNEGNSGGWSGWSFKGQKDSAAWLREPQTPNNYVLLDKDNNLIDRDDAVKPNATIAGVVKDTQNALITGATVTLKGGDEDKTTTTGSDGWFFINDVDPEKDYTIIVSKEGFLNGKTTCTRAELRAANGGRVTKDLTLASSEGVTFTKLTGTVKNVIDGAVANAKVRVDAFALETTADESGAFELDLVPANRGEIVVTAAGSNAKGVAYGDTDRTITQDQLTADGTTALGDVEIRYPTADGKAFADGGNKGAKKGHFPNINVSVTRTFEGFLFHFDGERAVEKGPDGDRSKIEMYIDAKESFTQRQADPNMGTPQSNGKRGRDIDPTAWRLDIRADGLTGEIVGTHFASEGSDPFNAQGLVYTILTNDANNGYEATLFIPYTWLKIEKNEVIGVSFGFWSGEAKDWDGWSSPNGFVAPEDTASYLRIGLHNEFYAAGNNTAKSY